MQGREVNKRISLKSGMRHRCARHTGTEIRATGRVGTCAQAALWWGGGNTADAVPFWGTPARRRRMLGRRRVEC